VLRHISVILNSLQHNAIEPQLAQFRQNTSQIQQSISQFDKIFEFEANQLDTINSDMSNNKQILESTIAKAHDTISTIHSTPQPQPDDTIIAESIPQGQLYELVSQDMAINDTLTALNSAFSQGKIPLVSLLKHSRQLSRDQFEKRTLIRKISAQLGLSL
jgi:ABC-type transporter Mla subunit MlaD